MIRGVDTDADMQDKLLVLLSLVVPVRHQAWPHLLLSCPESLMRDSILLLMLLLFC